jgi:RNA polymerase sigma-70 factor (sigma-E family)
MRNDDSAGFDEWAHARLGELLRFATALSCDSTLAEDLVQEVLIRAYRDWDRIAGLDRPEAYVRRMLVNEHLRWRHKWSRYIVAAGVYSSDPEPDPAEHHAERAALIAELARLPPRQRAVLAMRYYADMSDADIADMLSCRQVTVRTQAFRALAKLRVRLHTAAPTDAVTTPANALTTPANGGLRNAH